MIKNIALATAAMFLAFTALDYLIHQVILAECYMETAQLWRSMEEMSKYMPWMSLITLIYSALFSVIYALCISPKSIAMGLKFGALLGLAMGIGMASMYLVMPITIMITLVWLVGCVVSTAIAGLIAAVIIKD